MMNAIKKFIQNEFVLICIVLFGTVPRICGLHDQLLAGDEWHAIHNALYNGYTTILTSLGIGSISIPDSLYYKLAIDTIGLSEMVVRLPPLIAGVLIILILPILIRPVCGRFTANLFACLLALSPILILYSRFARPYSMMVLCGFASVSLFHHWWFTSSRRSFILYVILTTVTAYFLILAIPFILSPFLYFFVLILLGKGECRWHSLRRLLGIAIATVIPLILLLSPPFFTSLTDLTKLSAHATSAIKIETMADTFAIFTGKDNLGLTVCMGLFMLIGIIGNYRKANLYLVYLITLSMIQIAFITIVRPVAGNGPHIFARYILLVLPVLLLLVSMGMDYLFSRLKVPFDKWLKFFVAVVFCGVIFLGGPIPSMRFYPNNAMSLSLFSYMIFGSDYRQKQMGFVKRIPDFYHQLAMHPPASLTIAEAPYHYAGDHIPFYQTIHRQNLKIGFINGLCSETRGGEIPIFAHNINFSNYVFLKQTDSVRNKGIHYVIFHKCLEDEITWIPEYNHLDISNCIKEYKKAFGEPVFEDRDIVAFSTMMP
jgi:hypothetical protein